MTITTLRAGSTTLHTEREPTLPSEFMRGIFPYIWTEKANKALLYDNKNGRAEETGKKDSR